jgi:hypothetical protein
VDPALFGAVVGGVIGIAASLLAVLASAGLEGRRDRRRRTEDVAREILALTDKAVDGYRHVPGKGVPDIEAFRPTARRIAVLAVEISDAQLREVAESVADCIGDSSNIAGYAGWGEPWTAIYRANDIARAIFGAFLRDQPIPDLAEYRELRKAMALVAEDRRESHAAYEEYLREESAKAAKEQTQRNSVRTL